MSPLRPTEVARTSIRPSNAPAILRGGITSRLVALVAVVLLPAVLLQAWVAWERVEHRRSQALQIQLEAARGVAATFHAFLSDLHRTALALGEAIAGGDDPAGEEAGRLLRAMAPRYVGVRNLSWVSPDGVVVASSDPRLAGARVSDREYVARVVSGADWALGDLQQGGAATGRPTAALASAVRLPDGRLAGLVLCEIEPDRLGDLTLVRRPGSSAAYAVFDSQGTLVYRSPTLQMDWPARKAWLADDPVLAQVMADGQARTGITRPLPGGEAFLSARVPIHDTGWFAGAGRLLEEEMAPLRQRLIRDALLTLAAFALAGLLAWAVARKIVTPLRRLEQAAREAGETAALPDDPGVPAELRELRHSFAALVERLSERGRDLHETARRLRVIIEASPVGIVLTDTEGRIVETNEAYLKIIGQAREDVLAGRMRRERITPEAHWPKDAEAIAQAIQRGSSQPYEKEYLLADGRRIPVLVSYSALERGQLVAFVLDLSERKRAEEALRAALSAAEMEQRRMDAVLRTLPVGLAIADASGVVTLHNRVLEDIWGAPPLGTRVPDYGAFRGWWADSGAPLAAQDWAMARALRTGQVVPGDVVEVERSDGLGRCTVLNAAAPIRDPDGRIAGAVLATVDITAQRQAEQALREADRRKDEFLATLSHELRNPLAPLRTGLQVLRMKGADARRRDEVQAMMERQVAHMVRLIDDLLDLSRITTGKLRLKQEAVDLVEILRAAAHAVDPLIAGRRHRLDLSLPDAALPVVGDPVRLSQVAVNLLTNAAKYTPDGGRIALAAGREGRQATFSVSDTGLGIPADKLEAIFDLFTQVHSRRGHGEEGLGIGLNLVKRLVEMHGGTVRATSPGPNRGSEFCVHLPLAFGAAQPAPGPPRARPQGRLKVLAVDDNADVARSLAIMLELAGHEVHKAHDGESAIRTAERVRPDLVLLDISMPGIDGYEAARRIRERAWGASVCLVAMSGWPLEDDEHRRLVEAGFAHHVVKPMALADLEPILSRCGYSAG